MAKSGLIDLVGIQENRDPALLELINSAPAGQGILLDNASIARFTAAIEADNTVALANRPDRNRIRSSDPTLDAVLEKEQRLSDIEGKLAEIAVNAFDEAATMAGVGTANATIRGFDLALMFDPENKTILERRAAAEKQRNAATANIPALQERIAQKNAVGLIQEKQRLTTEVAQLRELRVEGETIDREPVGIDPVLAKINGTTTANARRLREQGAHPPSEVKLAASLASNTILTVGDPTVLADEDSRQAFTRWAIVNSSGELREEIEQEASEAYAFMDRRRTELAASKIVIDAVARGQKAEDVISSQLRGLVGQYKRDRLRALISLNPNWLIASNVSSEEMEIQKDILDLLEDETSGDGQVNLSNAIQKYIDSKDFRDLGKDPKEVISKILGTINKMSNKAVSRYNASHKELGLDLAGTEFKKTLDIVISNIINKASEADRQQQRRRDVQRGAAASFFSGVTQNGIESPN